jgi:hypothetical protein
MSQYILAHQVSSKADIVEKLVKIKVTGMESKELGDIDLSNIINLNIKVIDFFKNHNLIILYMLLLFSIIM